MKEQTPARDYRQELTEKLIELLEEGTAPWQKPWDGRVNHGARLPYNPTTDKPYRGANSLGLSATAMAHGYADPRWCTYRQAEAAGWQVRKGEKGSMVEYWKYSEEQPIVDSAGKPVLDDKGEPKTREVMLDKPRVFRAVVFNLAQMDNVPELSKEPRTYEWEPEQRAEQILQGSGAKIYHDQHDRAFYSPAADEIHMPGRDQFSSSARYYSTALHELGHWTGHESRLKREFGGGFGSVDYAKEELRAELSSYFMADKLGIPHDPGQHAAYVKSWVKVLKEDKNEIFRAARDAERITEFVMALDRTREKVQDVEVGIGDGQGIDVGDRLKPHAVPDQGTPEFEELRRASVLDRDASGEFYALKFKAQQQLGEGVGYDMWVGEVWSGEEALKGRVIAEGRHLFVVDTGDGQAVALSKINFRELPSIGQVVEISQGANGVSSIKLSHLDHEQARPVAVADLGGRLQAHAVPAQGTPEYVERMRSSIAEREASGEFQALQTRAQQQLGTDVSYGMWAGEETLRGRVVAEGRHLFVVDTGNGQAAALSKINFQELPSVGQTVEIGPRFDGVRSIKLVDHEHDPATAHDRLQPHPVPAQGTPEFAELRRASLADLDASGEFQNLKVEVQRQLGTDVSYDMWVGEVWSGEEPLKGRVIAEGRHLFVVDTGDGKAVALSKINFHELPSIGQAVEIGEGSNGVRSIKLTQLDRLQAHPVPPQGTPEYVALLRASIAERNASGEYHTLQVQAQQMLGQGVRYGMWAGEETLTGRVIAEGKHLFVVDPGNGQALALSKLNFQELPGVGQAVEIGPRFDGMRSIKLAQLDHEQDAPVDRLRPHVVPAQGTPEYAERRRESLAEIDASGEFQRLKEQAQQQLGPDVSYDMWVGEVWSGEEPLKGRVIAEGRHLFVVETEDGQAVALSKINFHELPNVGQAVEIGEGSNGVRTIKLQQLEQEQVRRPLETIQAREFTGDRGAVQGAVIAAVQADPDKFITRYKDHAESFGGRYVSADLFKETFEPYTASKEARNLYNSPVHNAAAVLASEQLSRAIEAQGHPERDTVVLLTGIPGAGKTSSVLVAGELPASVRAVYEGQLANPETAIAKVGQVLDAGLKPVIMVVHTAPEKALENTLKRFDEVGRGASIGVMSSIQAGLPAGLQAVKERFGDQVELQIIDRRDFAAPQMLKGWEQLTVLSSEGNHEQIKQRLTAALEDQRSAGLGDDAYNQALGKASRSRAVGLDRSDARGHDADGDGRGRAPESGEAAVLSRSTERVDLVVPFKEKNEAKALGAKWDKTASTWYAPEGTDLAPLERWMPKPPEVLAERAPADALSDPAYRERVQGLKDVTAAIQGREAAPVRFSTDSPGTQPEKSGPLVSAEPTYLAVPFKEKNEAREMGAKWDKEAKTWYAPAGTDLAPLQRWMPQQQDLQTERKADPQRDFGDAIRAAGLVLDGDPVMDGKLHRVAIEGRPKGLDGAYVGYLDGRPAGHIQNFVTGEKQNWKLEAFQVDEAQRAELAAQAAVNKQRRAAELADQHEEASRKAQYRWDKAQPMSPAETTAYTERKQVPALGLRRDGENLLVPLRDADGKLWSVQTIFPEKKEVVVGKSPIDKVLTKDAKKEGNFHMVGQVEQGATIVVAEGYATAASVHLATGLATAMAVDSGNLEAVVTALQAKHPTSPIFIAADDDRFPNPERLQNPNAGLTKAIETASNRGVGVLVPNFSTEGKRTDFNDLHVSEGLAVVRHQVKDGIERGMALSHGLAVSLAAERLGIDAQVVSPGEATRHTGEVLGVTDYHATQATGRSSAVVHTVAALDRRLEPGTVATIQYNEGRGQVKERQQEVEKKRHVER